MYFIHFFFFIHSFSKVSHDPLTEPKFPVIQNQGFITELNKTYLRFPKRAQNIVKKLVWDYSLDSAGLAIYFKTNSSTISISYKCSKPFSLPNMNLIGVSGVDILTKNDENKWLPIQSKFLIDHKSKKITFTFSENRKSLQGFEYRLYLPLYNSISDLLIDVDDNSFFTWIEKDYSKPIVMYGTSILQGCCSSRSILSWSNLVQLHFGLPVLNFGFSGSGKLEEEVVNLISENEAILYVFDCLPNVYFFNTETIKNLVKNGINLIRKKWKKVPILLVDFVGLDYQFVDKKTSIQIDNANSAQKEVVDKFVSDGDVNIFYLSKDEIGLTFECWTDYIHPNNYGMMKYANAYIKKIESILKFSNASQKIERQVVNDANRLNMTINLNGFTDNYKVCVLSVISLFALMTIKTFVKEK